MFLFVEGRKFTDVVIRWNGFIPLLLFVLLLEKVFHRGGLDKNKAPSCGHSSETVVEARPVTCHCASRGHRCLPLAKGRTET